MRATPNANGSYVQVTTSGWLRRARDAGVRAPEGAEEFVAMIRALRQPDPRSVTF